MCPKSLDECLQVKRRFAPFLKCFMLFAKEKLCYRNYKTSYLKQTKLLVSGRSPESFHYPLRSMEH